MTRCAGFPNTRQLFDLVVFVHLCVEELLCWMTVLDCCQIQSGLRLHFSTRDIELCKDLTRLPTTCCAKSTVLPDC